MKKTLLSIITACSILVGSSINAMAADNKVSPRYIPDENEYVHSSTSYLTSEDWHHESNNPTSIVQSTSYSVARMVKADFKASYSETIDAMIAKVGFNLEVSIGTSTTWTESHTYNIPANSTWMLVYGSKLVKESGQENLWRNGKLSSSRTVYGNWSYCSFDTMRKLK